MMLSNGSFEGESFLDAENNNDPPPPYKDKVELSDSWQDDST